VDIKWYITPYFFISNKKFFSKNSKDPQCDNR
jgi:hypothetical protein